MIASSSDLAQMADQQQRAPGGHYSGSNPVPTIKKFVENLDRDKKERDRKIDEQQRAQKHQGPKPHQTSQGGKSGTRRTVHDPTTGKEVQIEDVDLDAVQAVENPQVHISSILPWL